jgi:hypothetical protein
LTAVRLLAPQLTDENQAALVEAAAGKSKRELEVLLAARFPKPDVPTVVRKLPAANSPRGELEPGGATAGEAKTAGRGGSDPNRVRGQREGQAHRSSRSPQGAARAAAERSSMAVFSEGHHRIVDMVDSASCMGRTNACAC